MFLFQKGDKVRGKRFEFEGVKGEVVGHLTSQVVLVKFEDCPITVATMYDNLEKIEE